MRLLIESSQWRLLQELGPLLIERLARYQVRPGPLSGFRPHAELFEVELRYAFAVREAPRDLDDEQFDQCQLALERLCILLNDLAFDQPAYHLPDEKPYPRLRALTRSLESPDSTLEPIDLANGPNKTVFRLPHEHVELDKCLSIVTECNSALNRLMEPPPEELANHSRQNDQVRQNKRAWKKGRVRNRASVVLGNLFPQFQCKTSHEVLLRLIEDPDEDSKLPSLYVMLSPCPKLEPWQEARCDEHNVESSMLRIHDICTDLKQHAGQGKALTLLTTECALLGLWDATAPSPSEQSSRRSLDQLIQEGAFKSLDLNTLFDKASPENLSLMDKRKLAVKLGFCLMDFFDVNLASNRIYFLYGQSNSLEPPQKPQFPYLAFGPGLPAPGKQHKIGVGHPALLSFAKLLLEIEFGQSINLRISPNSDENLSVWVELLEALGRLEEERNDSYTKAIRGCLLVQAKISNAHVRRELDSRKAHATIRKRLYEEVVCKLEQGLDESTPRRKRQRSESPTVSTRGRAQSAGSTTPYESPERESTRRHKRERHAEPQQVQPFTPNPPPNEPSGPSLARRPGRATKRDEFEVAIICALPLEYDAVTYLFDDFWDNDGDQYGKASGDPNNYTTGRMGNYNVVLALLSQMGKASAASAAASMRSSYSGLRLALLVGVCGAAPRSRDGEILLGDVVISKRVVQHDFGRQNGDKFVRKTKVDENLGRAGKNVRNLLALFETDRGRDQLEAHTASFLQKLQAKVALTRRQGKYDYPGAAKDKLFKSSYPHKHHVSPTCICGNSSGASDPVCDEALTQLCEDLGCNDSYLVPKRRTETRWQSGTDKDKPTHPRPAVHVGAVASGDAVIKSAAYRDTMAREEGVIAFEMEGAGIWDEMPSIVVKGVCDYADCHKNKSWQNFAAATAASTCRAILERYIQEERVASAVSNDGE